MENHLKDLEDDRRSELLENDELLGQLKEKEKKIKEQEDVINTQEEKFKAWTIGSKVKRRETR